jgi:DNA-binding response OmpR family regulator
MSATPPLILVVDDDVDACHNLADILSDLGYRVRLAHDGPSALELVRQEAYDVALLDLKMPGMDGLTLYREIRKLRAETVAIVVTAYAGSKTEEEVRTAGAWRLLHKPVDFDRLLPLVSQAVGQPLILVVDDDPDLCASLWDLCRERGFRVSVAHDEETAAARLQDRSFNVVLVDMRLPQGDGAGVFRRVRRVNPQARVVLITGFRSEMDQLIQQQVLREGADAVCEKPFDMPRLLATLERLTGNSPASADSESPGP